MIPRARKSWGQTTRMHCRRASGRNTRSGQFHGQGEGLLGRLRGVERLIAPFRRIRPPPQKRTGAPRRPIVPHGHLRNQADLSEFSTTDPQALKKVRMVSELVCYERLHSLLGVPRAIDGNQHQTPERSALLFRQVGTDDDVGCARFRPLALQRSLHSQC